MSISVVTTFILTGFPERLREIAEQRGGRTCDADDMRFASDTELHMSLYNGAGAPMLHHGDGLAAEYSDVRIHAVETMDNAEQPAFGRWENGQTLYRCEMATITSCETIGVTAPNQLRLWNDCPGLARAVEDNFPGADLMTLRHAPAPVPGWISASNAVETLFLRLPTNVDQADGVAVLMSPEEGLVMLLGGINHFGGCAQSRFVSYAAATARHPELRSVLRVCWQSKKDGRRSDRRNWGLQRRAMRKRRWQNVDQTSVANWWSGDDMDIAF